METVSSLERLSTTITSRAHASCASVRPMFASSSRVRMTGVTSAAEPLILRLHLLRDARPGEFFFDEPTSAIAHVSSHVFDSAGDRARVASDDEARLRVLNVVADSDARRDDH